MEALWSRPLWKDHHDNRVASLRLSGDRRAGAARAVDTVRNSRRVGAAAGVVPILTVHVPAIVLLYPLR